MSRAAKEARSQAAADAVGTIADTVDELHKLLDKFFAENGAVATEKFEHAWPGHKDINLDIVKRLNRLSDDLAPPDGGKGDE